MGPGRPPQDQGSAVLGKLVAISPHSGQGWEWEQQTLHLQPSVGPVTVASTLFATGRLNVSSSLREELEIHIPVVGGEGLYFKKTNTISNR